MNTPSSISPASYTVTTLGCLTFAIARASRDSFARTAGSTNRGDTTSLIAISRSSCGSRAA